MKPLRLGLRARLTASAVAVILALTLAYSLIAANRVRNAHDRETGKHGAAIARQLAAEAELPLRAGDTAALYRIADSALAREEIIAVEFRGTGDGLIVRRAKKETREQRTISLVQPISSTSYADEIGLLTGAETAGPEKILGEVRLTLSLAGSDRIMAEIEAAMAAAALVLAALAILANVHLARRVTGPLLTLEKGARRIGEGHFDERIAVSGSIEIEALAGEFNRMAENLKLTLDQTVQQEKMASLGRMASGITHELGNPLNALLLETGMLVMDLPEGEDKEKAQNILREARRMKEIVSQLLDYARAPSSEMQPVDLAACVEDALRVLAHPINKARFTVNCDFPSRLPRARAVRTTAVQVFVNVIANAIDAAGKDGRLDIAAKTAEGNRIVITLADNGPGIPPECLEHVFDPFYTTKQDQGGTGLGLSICRQIMTAFGGRILAQRSEAGATQIVVEFHLFTTPNPI